MVFQVVICLMLSGGSKACKQLSNRVEYSFSVVLVETISVADNFSRHLLERIAILQLSHFTVAVISVIG